MSRNGSSDGTGWIERMPVGLLIWLAVLTAWGTWAPFVRTAVPQLPELRLPDRPLEVLGNLLLMAPLGLVVGLSGRGVSPRRRIARAALAAAALSIAVETGQVFVTDRFTSLVDVLLNTLGSAGAAATGIALVRRGASGVAMAAATTAAVWLAVLGYVAIGFDHAADELRVAWWNPRFPVLEGSEYGGGRPFRGKILESRICAGEGAERVCAAPGADRPTREALARAARNSQLVELTARVLPAAEWQEGPARILSFSLGPELRNATLGQQGSALSLRLRTPLSGLNGSRPSFDLTDAFSSGGATSLLARFEDKQVTLRAEDETGVRGASFHVAFLGGWVMKDYVRRLRPAVLRRAELVTAVVLLFPLGLAVAALVRRRWLVWLGAPLLVGTALLVAGPLAVSGAAPALAATVGALAVLAGLLAGSPGGLTESPWS